MAHTEQEEFVKIISRQFGENFINCKVLEIGSLNINGSIKKYFKSCDYMGLDIAPGKDVDIVCQGQDFNAPDNTFDTVISCEVMEHNPYWNETTQNMIRMCKPEGLVIITCATLGRGKHGTSKSDPESSPLTVSAGWSYYRNLLKKDFKRETNLNEFFDYYKFWTNWNSFDLYFLGVKKSGIINNKTDSRFRNAAKLINNYTWRKNLMLKSIVKCAIANLFGDSGIHNFRKFQQILKSKSQ